MCWSRISVRVPCGSLVAVVGHVGSGKSSLLSAMLGETEKRSGAVSVKVLKLINHNSYCIYFIKYNFEWHVMIIHKVTTMTALPFKVESYIAIIKIHEVQWSETTMKIKYKSGNNFKDTYQISKCKIIFLAFLCSCQYRAQLPTFPSKLGSKMPVCRTTFCLDGKKRKAGISGCWKPVPCCQTWTICLQETPLRSERR